MNMRNPNGDSAIQSRETFSIKQISVSLKEQINYPQKHFISCKKTKPLNWMNVSLKNIKEKNHRVFPFLIVNERCLLKILIKERKLEL